MKKMDSLNDENARFVRARISQKFLRTCGAFIPAVGLLACANIAFAEAEVVSDTENADAQKSVPATKNTAAKLPTTVVVATRTEVALEKVSPSVTVISAEEMGTQQVRNISDVLYREAGLTVFGGNATGTPTSLSVRGTSSSSTVIMLDGRRMNGGIYGQYGLGTLTMDNLSSVQILRGSASTLYGSSAIGGAIDLRTVNGLDSEGFTGSAWGEFGTWNSRTLGVNFAGNTNFENSDLPKNIGFSAGLSYSASDGYNWNNDYEQTVFLPRIDWQVSDKLAFNIVSRIFEKEYGCPGSDLYRSYTDREKDSGFMISPEMTISPLENLTGKIMYSYSEYKSEGYVAGLVDNQNKAQQVAMQWDWQAFENLLVSAGYDFIQDDYFARADPNMSSWGNKDAGVLQYSNSVWANAQFEVVKNLQISAGARYTDTNKYGDRTTYEVATQYRIEATGTSVFAKISTGFRTPNYTDLSPNWSYVAGDDLEAEKSTSYEIGLKQELFEKQLNLSATFFLIDTKDKFAYGYSSSNVTYVYNINEARSNGIELAAEWIPACVSGLKVYGNATFQDAWDRDTDVRLKLVPQFTGTLGAEYVFMEDFTLGAAGTFVKGREGGSPVYPYNQADMGDYLVVRAYGNWTALRYADGREKLSVFARVENALDRKYDDYNIGYEAPGAAAYVGAKLSF